MSTSKIGPQPEVQLKEIYITTNQYLDTSSTLRWKIDNFALLTMRQSELRSPEFEGPKGTRWVCVLILGDPRQRKAEERFVEGQLHLIYCPDDAAGFKVYAGHATFESDEMFTSCGSVETEPTGAIITATQRVSALYYSWHYPNSLTTLFQDKCSLNGALRLVITVNFEVANDVCERNLEDRRFPMNMPHFIPNMLHLNDLFFVTQQGDRVPAHKAFMREISDVLREAVDCMGVAEEICLKQFNTNAVREFVVYCYTGVLHETAIKGVGVEVLKLGHVFNVPGVVEEAADYLIRNVELEGELRCFKIANEYGAHTRLRKAALYHIARKYPRILNSPEATLVAFTTEYLCDLKTELASLRVADDLS